MAKTSLKYYWDKTLYTGTRAHNSPLGVILYGAMAVSSAFAITDYVYDAAELPVVAQSTQKNARSDRAYQIFDQQITQMQAARQSAAANGLELARRDMQGENIEKLTTDIEARQDQAEEWLEKFYGYFLQNEDITEPQFAKLQNRLVEYGLTTEEIDLKGVNPDSFKECQLKEGVNDGYDANYNARGVESCMHNYSNPEDYKSSQAAGAAIVGFLVSGMVLLILGGVVIAPLCDSYQSWRRKPRKEDYRKKPDFGN